MLVVVACFVLTWCLDACKYKNGCNSMLMCISLQQFMRCGCFLCFQARKIVPMFLR